MSTHWRNSGQATAWQLMPLMVLLLAVLVPTACVLWFMTQAMRNDHLAVREKLTRTYQGRLEAAQAALEAYWSDQIAILARSDLAAGAASQRFAGLVRSGVVDSVIVCDESGNPVYPLALVASALQERPRADEWVAAEKLEYEDADFDSAAGTYAEIAKRTKDVNESVCALEAQIRCLIKAKNTQQALEVIQRLSVPKYADSVNRQGRFIVPNAQVLAVTLIDDPTNTEYKTIVAALAKRLSDYQNALPSGQRRFLMKELSALAPDVVFDTLSAEDLAAAYLESDTSTPADGQLTSTPLGGTWRLASAGKTVVALYRSDRIVPTMQSIVEEQTSLPDVKAAVLSPGVPLPTRHVLTIDAGEHLPGWVLVLQPLGPDPFATAVAKQRTAYLWTAILVILAIVTLALFVARYIGRQMKLTRLKNDLVATVTHELKTPLSSMRVLVDTLLEGKVRDDRQVRDYLELMAKENVRLSRLIDNFLTFSRMERNKQAFEFVDVRVDEIVDAAVDAVRERFESNRCRLDVHVEQDLPTITADRDAMIGCLVNLLDNAYKYSENDRRITLRAYTADGAMCFEVEDNGIGMSRRATKKVFDRFYQVDQSLSRSVGGCGLGLSIVKFVVDAHGGSIDVVSQPGLSSTFTVKLPLSQLPQA